MQQVKNLCLSLTAPLMAVPMGVLLPLALFPLTFQVAVRRLSE